jgi:Family of unknown function (DUF6084)
LAQHVPLLGAESLPRLAFAVESAHAVEYSAAPTVAFTITVECDMPVRSLSLNAQVRIAPTRRAYDAGEAERLVELFGTPDRWSDTLRGFLWANVTAVVPPFEGTGHATLTVPCTYDLDVAATKYFRALGDGEVPLELLFSGTVFYLGDGGALRTVQVPWECEAQFRLPVSVWREAMDNHFPNSAWVRVHRDVFDRLAAYKASRTLPTWDAAFEDLLGERER